MADIYSQEKRSSLMAQVGPTDTAPELRVRRLLHKLGYRYRLHRRDLPGSPDMVFPSLRLVVFVHGCFWHSHPGCKGASVPETNAEFWKTKLSATVRRDRRQQEELKRLGWNVAVVWECETRRPEMIIEILREWLPDLMQRWELMDP